METERVPFRGGAARDRRGDVGERGEEHAGDVEAGQETPQNRRALRKGRLSGSKARAIAAAAAVKPEAEDALLDLDEATPFSEVQKRCLEARAGDDRDAAHKRIHDERTSREYTDAEGAWNLHARGTLEDGAAFRAAHGPIVHEMFAKARADGRRETPGAYAFDALIELARRGSGTATSDAKPTPVSHMALIRIDHSALVRGAVMDDEICEICGLGPIPVWVARKMLGDAVLKLVITEGVAVANVTHLGRSATIAQQVALWWQQSACTVLGCTRTRRLQNDHRYEWVKTKRTRVDELDPLCKHHHDLKTYDNWALIQGTGPRPMVAPTNPRHPKNRPPPREPG